MFVFIPFSWYSSEEGIFFGKCLLSPALVVAPPANTIFVNAFIVAYRGQNKESDVYLNLIDPKTENTFIISKRSNVIGKYINIKPTAENFSLIQKRLDQTINEYFNLPTDDRE